MRQIRKQRPTIDTAHKYHREGIYLRFSPEMIVTKEERVRFVDVMAEKLERLIKEQFPRSANLEYAILKAHLIVEYAITEYIRGMSSAFLGEEDFPRFTFAQKVDVAYLLGLGVTDAVLIPTIERLNKIRNQAAHTFTLNRALVDEMLRVNSNNYDGFSVATDRERVRLLRALCTFIAGHISGIITAHVHTAQNA